MKHAAFAVIVFAGFLGAGSVNAQTCAAPGVWTPSPSGAPALVMDLCSGSESVALYCDFLDSAGKNDAVWQLSFAAGFTASQIAVSGGAAGFNPVIYLYSSTCASGSGCVASGDTANPLPLAGVSPGSYFLAVTAASADASGACGAVILSTNGYVPVSLQAFSID
ncbi:hypothetical protein [Dokdonella sp.]|uniref:hypothetical protein n=1 Tax=Dokdonella sp. TaxID=2291710 RepID=UPI003783680C